MADTGAPRYPVVLVTDTGAPPGTVNVHDEATGRTINAPATVDGYLQAVRDLRK
jgi:hypothetical protein